MMRLWCVVCLMWPLLAQADDMGRAREVLVQLGQGLQAREAARVRELLAPAAVVTVTVVEPDAAPSFSFGREDFLQTYTSLWKFSSKENVVLTLRSIQPDGEGWVATGDIRESMRVLGEEYRRESVVTARVRKRGDKFLIESVGLRTVIR